MPSLVIPANSLVTKLLLDLRKYIQASHYSLIVANMIFHSKNPWEDFQESLRAMVTTEATAMLNDPDIKHPNEQSGSFADTLWPAMAEENSSTAELEAGKASFSSWVELAVEELSKVAIRDVGNQVQNETKRALIVITERHHEFLRNKLDNSYEDMRSRLEVED